MSDIELCGQCNGREDIVVIDNSEFCDVCDRCGSCEEICDYCTCEFCECCDKLLDDCPYNGCVECRDYDYGYTRQPCSQCR